MKKIFTIILLFILTLSSSFATTWVKTTLNSDDLLMAKIFYINWEWYIKENAKLKKVENVKFYTIAGQKYIKKAWKIEKIKETKIYKINNTSYVKDNNKLLTLEKFLKTNKVEEINKKWTFSEIHKETLDKAKKENKEDEEVDNIFKSIFEESNEWNSQAEGKTWEKENWNNQDRLDETKWETNKEEEDDGSDDIFNEIFSEL